MKKGFILLLCIFALVTLLPFHQALAQDSAWSDVVDSNGNILYDQMSDQGVVTQAADWMPSITLPIVGTVSVPAEYHSYVTASGNTVQQPPAQWELTVRALVWMPQQVLLVLALSLGHYWVIQEAQR
ncbi:hypothetical protein [Candidatus Villigracilis affinis]|uniref:hypothetical protein n=1 Tax=Candidatus Villigracilis affinis TaxID=3140682 RepID=UPI001DF20833|nr:hypothetical protein [Anaerolineales bacterium]